MMNNLTLFRKNPFMSIQKELNRAMDDFYSVFEKPSDNLKKLTISPSIDIVEDKDNFKVEAEIPGVGEDAIKVSIDNGILKIHAKKESSKKDEGKNYVYQEIGYGEYERQIRLPDYVDADQAKASFRKGMLWVNIPKKAGSHSETRELKIEKA